MDQLEYIGQRVEEGFAQQGARAQEVLSRIDARYDDLLRTFDSEAENGPRLFTLVPADRKWRKPGWLTQRFRLTLLCEHSRLPVHILSSEPETGVYEIERPRAWVVSVAPIVKLAAQVISVALPMAKAAAEIHLDAEHWKQLQGEIDAAQEGLLLLSEALTEPGNLDPTPALAMDSESEPVGSALRELHALLRERDPGFGGLEKVRNKRREVIWVHPQFLQTYRPPPPLVPGGPGS
jgi:hypothetical protein